MKNCIRRTTALTALLALLCLAPAPPASAQQDKTDQQREEEDLRVEKIRARLDNVRKTRKRPTVALVLSGGGAKGAAHVGVISYLDSLGIPVDVVLGTSMGGLVGGIYALGHTPQQLDSIIRSINWDMALSDKVPREYLSYSKLKYKNTYVLSFPFYYQTDEFRQQVEDQMQYPRRSEDLHFGADGADEVDASRMVKENILGSLPSGMAYGQNVNNIFSSLTVGYQDDCDFYDLPIPFICVATDLVSGTAKVWTEGKINTALRSTMSIPGLFTPVKADGMVLVDGGMRNNYPTDIARKIGADIIIGVSLNSGYRGYGEINNLGDIIDAGIDLMGRDSFRTNVDIPDISIKPDLHEYSMMSFDTKSISIIIDRGYQAARAVAPQLDSLKRLLGSDTTVLSSRPAADIGSRPVMVSGVEIKGVSDEESLYLMNRLKVKAGTMMGNSEIEDAVATIFGTDSFDYVNYELTGTEEPYRLVFNCKKGPINNVGFGARFDTEEIVAVLLNIGIGVQKIRGSSFDFTGKIGANPYVLAEYSYCMSNGLSVNLGTSYRFVDRSKFNLGFNKFTLNVSDWRGELYLSNIQWSEFYLKTGIRADRYNLGSIFSESFIGEYDEAQKHNGYLSAFLDARNDCLDNPYVPSSGHSVGLSYQLVFGSSPSHIKDVHALTFDAKKVFGEGTFSFIPSLNLRFLIGEDVPLIYSNYIGGTMNGRYMDQQIAFYGIDNVAMMRKDMAVLRADFRLRLSQNNYISAIANYAASANTLADFGDFKNSVSSVYGAALKYTYNSIIGPICADIHWSTQSNKVGVFFSIGFDF
ncbi:MAG: patatin-like phospholipase family protein [Candidatus Cryptobacteroides sp.]